MSTGPGRGAVGTGTEVAGAAPPSVVGEHGAMRSASDRVTAARRTLSAKGERVTTPRLAVIEALADLPGHPDADTVHDAVHDAVGMHRATTYRVLHHLVEVGIVTHVHPEGSSVRYHLADEGDHRHVHLSCLVCGRVQDAPPDLLEAAADRLAAEGIELHPTHVALSITCADCAEGADDE